MMALRHFSFENSANRSQRSVVFLRDQNITLEQQHELASYYGIVSAVDPSSCIIFAKLDPSKIGTRTK